MIEVGEAVGRIVSGLEPVPAERVTIGAGLGRILAEDIVAGFDQPATAVSAMDGYAVRAADVGTVPVDLSVIATIAAGPLGQVGTAMPAVGHGAAARIFTGAPLPPAADAVVIQEDTERLADGRVRVCRGVGPGRHVRAAGGDFRTGDRLVAAGCRLDPRALALAASAGLVALRVRRRPRVALLATGDELVMPGEPRLPGQIVSSNSVLLAAEVAALGGEPVDLGIAGDDAGALAAAIMAAAGCDALVTMGGASVGDHDLVRQVLDGLGFAAAFAKVAVRPGKPTTFGRLGGAGAGMPVLMLPGNPVSAGVAARLFLAPLLAGLLGRTDAAPAPAAARLAVPMPANDARQDYVRARLMPADADLPLATPMPRQDSALLAAYAAADALIIRPPQAAAAAAGDIVPILSLG